MKRIIAVLLAVIAIAALCSCSKKDSSGIDAIMDYYVVRCGNEDMTEKSIKYVGENEEQSRDEYRIENEDLGISETLFVEEWGGAIGVYNEDGIRIHIYTPEATEK